MSLQSVKAWLITDGKAGDEQQCVGVLEAMDLAYTKIRVKPRWLYSIFMPYGPIDPKDDPDNPTSIIAQPFPDIAIASGRRAVAYLKKIKTASNGQCFTVFLKNPRTGSNAADFIWTPEHDSLRAYNVLTTLTSPHIITSSALEQAAKSTRFDHIKSPRIAVLLGGDSSLYKFTNNDCRALKGCLTYFAQSGAGLMVSPSRRTPSLLYEFIESTVKKTDSFFWDQTGKNPLIEMLGSADHIIVTADSVNMVGEAVSTGKPVHIFYPSKRFKLLSFMKLKSNKIDYFLNRLTEIGAIKQLEKKLEAWSYEKLNSTPIIAAAIETSYRAFISKTVGDNKP